MEDITLWTETIDWITLLINFAGLLFPTLFTAWGVLKGGERLWAVVRPWFDDKDDRAIVWLADKLRQNPVLMAEFITRVGDAATGEIITMAGSAVNEDITAPNRS